MYAANPVHSDARGSGSRVWLVAIIVVILYHSRMGRYGDGIVYSNRVLAMTGFYPLLSYSIQIRAKRALRFARAHTLLKAMPKLCAYPIPMN